MNEQEPGPIGTSAAAVARSVARTAVLFAERRISHPRGNRGLRLMFADGSAAVVYRESVVERGPTADSAVLVVAFRLRLVSGRRAHSLFRAESPLNTPLFIGFPGFVSKLWLANDRNGVYRGVYEWDGPERAEAYARALWRVLAIGCVPGSIGYRVLPGLRRNQVLENPATMGSEAAAWWRITGTRVQVR